MCLFPNLYLNKKYLPNKKNNGNPPPLPKRIINGKIVDDERVKFVPVKCGKCMECMKAKKNEWRVRLREELHNGMIGYFVTLTMSNESFKMIYDKYFKNEMVDGYTLDNLIATKSVRLFLERWRKKYKKSVRHWLITELGSNGTENLHLHGLIWTNHPKEEIQKKWNYGFVFIGEYVNERSINYMTKYCTKLDEKHPNYTPIILCSKGIGKPFFNNKDLHKKKYIPNKTQNFYRTESGIKLALPIYYKNKIYSEEDREKLWIELLDKGERYVLGEKINIKKNETEYFQKLKAAQEKNKRLKYGSDEKDWNKLHYERRKRKLNHKKRFFNI
jgi:hypothetical protein